MAASAWRLARRTDIPRFLVAQPASDFMYSFVHIGLHGARRDPGLLRGVFDRAIQESYLKHRVLLRRWKVAYHAERLGPEIHELEVMDNFIRVAYRCPRKRVEAGCRASLFASPVVPCCGCAAQTADPRGEGAVATI